MADVKVISLNVAMSMLSISDVLRNDKPDLLFLQEVSNSTETLFLYLYLYNLLN